MYIYKSNLLLCYFYLVKIAFKGRGNVGLIRFKVLCTKLTVVVFFILRFGNYLFIISYKT